MNEAEIELWYDEEKEKAMAKYLEKLNKNKDRKEAEKEYKERMKKIREKYERLYEKSKKPSLAKKCSDKIKDNMTKLVELYRE